MGVPFFNSIWNEEWKKGERERREKKKEFTLHFFLVCFFSSSFSVPLPKKVVFSPFILQLFWLCQHQGKKERETESHRVPPKSQEEEKAITFTQKKRGKRTDTKDRFFLMFLFDQRENEREGFAQQGFFLPLEKRRPDFFPLVAKQINQDSVF